LIFFTRELLCLEVEVNFVETLVVDSEVEGEEEEEALEGEEVEAVEEEVV